jgi:DNA-binding response OmpR family regulator
MEKKTILIVDDQNAVRSLCREELSDEGYEVIEAKNGKEALGKLKDNDPDLVILDIVMPEMDGMETLPRTLRKKPNTPVILYTAHIGYQKDFMTWAADAYVVKSSDLSELKEQVRQLLSVRGLNAKPQSF